MPTKEEHQLQQEGFAYSLALDLFPGLRKSHPVVFDNDVRFLYQWERALPGSSPNDPFDLRKHGDYKNMHAALLHTERFLHAPKQRGLLHHLQHGDIDTARTMAGANIDASLKLPAPLYHGYLDPVHAEQAAKDHVKHHGNVWDRIGGAASDTGGAIKSGAGDIAGLGGWIGKNLTLIVVVVVLIIVLKK